MSAAMSVVKLRNGAEAPAVMVTVTMLALESLLFTNPVALYELVTSCRDPRHVLFGNTGAVLIERSLVQSVDEAGRGRLESYVRDIVLSGVTGDGGAMYLCNPEVTP